MLSFNLKYKLIVIVTQIYAVSAFCQSANFTYNKGGNCVPITIEFTNSSTQGAGIDYIWDFGLGARIYKADYSTKKANYDKSGKYTVTLVVVVNGINTDSISKEISIAQGPKANLTANPISGCKPLLVNFTSASTPGDSAIIKTKWDFKNNDYLEGTSVPYTYNTPGKFGIRLEVTDKNGCSDIFERDSFINVISIPKVNFKASDTFACNPPISVTFNNLSTGESDLTYQWNYGNGKKSTDLSGSTVYDALGNYSVKLQATDQNGCTNSIEKKEYIKIGNPKGTLSVYDENNNIVTKSSLCSGTYRFVFSVSNLPMYTWTINDNNKKITLQGKNTLYYLVSDTGILDILLSYGNATCANNIQKTFSKNALKADFALDSTLFCSLPLPIELTNNSTNANNYTWYCSGKLLSNKRDTSYIITNDDISIDTFKRNYSHELDTIRIPFTLTVTNNEGCSDLITKEISISFPIARFAADKVSGCVPLVINLADSSKSTSKIDEYIYKIGDKTISTFDKTPVNYTIDTPGEYMITEIIKSGSCYDTSTMVKVVAGKKLIPDFTVTPREVCNGGQIHIIGTSNDNSLVNTWHFISKNICDLSFSSLPDTSISVFSDNTGYKDISLQIEYNGCLSDTTKKNIFKINGLAGNFVESFSCDSPLIYYFKSGIQPATSLTWEVNNAVFNDMDSLKYSFPASGDYIVNLTANDNVSGCTLTRSKLIKVRQIKAYFTLTDSVFCYGDTVFMDASLSENYINTCFNEGFLWDFGDDAAPRRTFSSTFDHVYSKKETFKLKLETKADNGCVDTFTRNVYVHKPAVSLYINKHSACLPGDSVTLINTSTDTSIISTIWDFSDGNTDLSQVDTIKHLYYSNKQITYYPSLTGIDRYGCSSTFSHIFTINSVNGNFQVDRNAICAGKEVTFSTIDKKLDSVYWNYGDNSSSTSYNHTYNDSGQYSVTLIASKNGCRNTVSKANFIRVEKANAQFLASDSLINCYPHTSHFFHKKGVSSPVTDYVWTFDGNESTNKSDSATYSYTHNGNYKIQLEVRTLNGCTNINSQNIKVSGPFASVHFTPSSACYNDPVTFYVDSISSVDNWELIFNDGTNSTVYPTKPIVHNYTVEGYIVPVVKLGKGTCTITQKLDTLFVSYQKLNFQRVPLGDTIINVGDSAYLNIFTNTSNLNYTWLPNYNISCLNCSSTVVVPLQDVTYQLNIKDKCLNLTENFNIKVILNYYLDAPSAFTPNGDFNNDIFTFRSKNIQNFDLKIFNRWGKIVYSTTNIGEGWDGKVNGIIQNTDTYVYFVKAETIYGYKFEKKGNFLLLK